MIRPAQAILWQIYWRSRWGFLAAGAFLLFSIGMTHVIPRHWTILVDGEQVPAAGWFLGVSCLFMNIMLMAAFTISGSDARNLTFATGSFVLPVRTSVLVFWPMFSGSILVVSVWLIDACFVFRAGGIAAPLWWPATALALFLTAFQATAWTPFAQRWLHLVVTVGMFIFPLLVAPVALVLGVSLNEPTAAALLAAFIPIAYFAAVVGVGRARRGEAFDWRAWGRFVEWLARRRPLLAHPFRSPGRAQLWYECRAHLIALIVVATMLPVFFFVPALERDNLALGWRLLGIMLGAPLMAAMLAGGSLGTLTDPTSNAQTASFVLVRPITSRSIILQKLVLAAIFTAVLWLLFLAYISLLLLRPGFAQSIGDAARRYPAWKAIGIPVLALALLVAGSWKIAVSNLWITLTGRKWVENLSGTITAALIFVGFAVGLWMGFHPQWHAAARNAVPWLVSLLLALKTALGVVIVRTVISRGILGRGQAAMIVAAWLAIVAALSSLALFLLPSELAAAKDVVPGIALVVPFGRLVGALLALDWNRHR